VRGAALLCLLAAAAPLALSACQSTADRSARIAGEGRRKVQAGSRLEIRPNGDVRVGRAVVIRGAGGAVAAAVELRNRSAQAQADVPVLIDVRDARGTSVYRNDAVGLQPALQRVALVRGHASAWWVNDQLLGAQAPRSVKARVGAAGRSGAHAPRIALRAMHFEGDATGRFLTGVVVNPLRTTLRGLAIFGVALRGQRVVAAGRALVPKLPPAGTRRQTTFRLFFVGDPRGAHVSLTVA
jgi:hypothetical protein